MKILYAWRDESSAPKGQLYLSGMWVSSSLPESKYEFRFVKFTVRKGESMDDVKAFLRDRKKFMDEQEQRAKEPADIRIIGSARAYSRAKYLPERTTGLSVSQLLR